MTITLTNLQTALLDLLYELRDSKIDLIVGGGYGIYLKREHIRKIGKQTLLTELPEPRSTNDLDLFLRPELLINYKEIEPLRPSLDKLGYKPIETALYYQFAILGPTGAEKSGTKIDLLTGPKGCFDGTSVKADDRRAKPSSDIELHAHPTDEAQTLENGLLQVTVTGVLTGGKNYEASVFLPHPYTFLMMKLFAFKDRYNDPDKEFGRYHALDLYTILATTTEDEWRYALTLRDQLNDSSFVIEAGNIVLTYFSAFNKMGIIRLKENTYYKPELEIESFMSALQELFP